MLVLAAEDGMRDPPPPLSLAKLRAGNRVSSDLRTIVAISLFLVYTPPTMQSNGTTRPLAIQK